MKKVNVFFVLFSLLAVSVIVLNHGCKKDRIETSEEKLNEYNSVNSYLDSKKEEEQEFVITGESNDTLVGKRGTRIYGSKQCLMFANGDTVGYPFTIKLVELYTPASMIYYQMPTVASGTILETGGEIRLRAFKDNQELVLKPSCPFAFEMPNASPKSYMTVFLGSNNGSFVNWTDTKTSFTTTSYGYLGYANSLGWINCDKQVGTGSGNTLTFTSTKDDLTNVGIFVYFPDTRTVMQVYNSVSGLIPDGSSVKIVMIGVNGSGLYSYTDSRTVNASATIDMSLSATTDADLTSYLDNL